MNNFKKNKIVFIVFFLSGFCSLVYQVTWERLIRSHFGGDFISAYIVTSTFLLGLGLGAYLFRKKKSTTFLTYAKVELLIGVFAVISYYFINSFSIQISSIFIDEIGFQNLRIILIFSCFIMILPPCILMGATLPLVFNIFFNDQNFKVDEIGLIYAINTIGATLGIFSIPFIFLNNINIKDTLFIVGLINIGFSFFLFYNKNKFLNRKIYNKKKHESTLENIDKYSKYLVYFLSFSSGAIALSMELIFFRSAAISWPSSAYNFPFVLMFFLSFLSFGSIFFSYLSRNIGNRIYILISFLFIASSLSILFFVFINAFLIPKVSQFVVLKYLVMIAPFAFFQGGIFPLILKIMTPSTKSLSQNTGVIYLINSLGAFIFTFIIQFYLFSHIGTKVIIFGLFFYGIICSVIISYIRNFRVIIYSIPLVVSIIFLFPSNYWKFYKHHKYHINNENEIFAIEGESGFSSIEYSLNSKNEILQGDIRVNGQFMSSIPFHPRHIELSIFTLNLYEKSKTLFLGLGGATILKDLVEENSTNEIDVIDWSFELPKLISFDRLKNYLNDVLNDKKINFFSLDARLYLNKNKKKYNLIFDNLSHNHWVGSTNIKSISYYEKVSKSLKKNGVYILAFNFKGKEDKYAVLSGVINSFKYVIQFNETIIIASNNSLDCLSNVNYNNDCVFDISGIENYIDLNKNKLPDKFKDPNWNLYENLLNISNNQKIKSYEPLYDNFPKFEYYK